MQRKYDVVIVGAGIGGLVCGCYLAKFGLRVLIVEQQDKPGGCCTSFERCGYIFDVGVHYLGSCRENGGIIANILKDLSLAQRINLIHHDPHDRILTPNEDIYIYKDASATLDQFKNYFPAEKDNLKRLFQFMLNKDIFSIYSQTRELSFMEFLNKFIGNNRLKSILSIPIGNIGQPPSRASAFISIMLYREYILDGGYYPQGGIQKFPDLLAARFKELGGELVLSKKVRKICASKQRVTAVVVENDEVFESPVVVCNCDATTLFTKLLSCESEEKSKVRGLELSASAVVLYLGLRGRLERTMERSICTWYFTTYDLEKCYDTRKYYNLKNFLNHGHGLDYLVCHFPTLVDKTLAPNDGSIVRIELWVQEGKMNLWRQNKDILCERILSKLNDLIPGVEGMIEVMEIATPDTIKKWVANEGGSVFGWASTVAQQEQYVFPSETSLEGLYLTGCWTTNGFGQCGVPIVVLSGKKTSETIMRKYKKRFIV